MMVIRNTRRRPTAFTVSVDARHGIDDRHLRRRPLPRPSRRSSMPRPGPTTSPAPGTSSRCATARAACSAAGHTEAAVDLARLAGLARGVLAEVVNDDGTMAPGRGSMKFAPSTASHHLDRRPHPVPPSPRSSCSASPRRIPTQYGDFTAYVFESMLDGQRAHGVRVRRGRRHTTCSCACTPSASPAMCSGPCAATAACNSTSRSSASPRKTKA